MSRGLIRRAFVVLAAPAIGLGMVAVLAGPAQANHVTDISADCSSVVVNFTDFPAGGTTVHIVASIAGVGTVSGNAVIDDNTTQATLDITSLTGNLAGATANVDVDVTWSLDGSHESTETIPLMCGTATTSTTEEATTTSTTEESTTTSTVEGTNESSSTSTSMPETVTTGGGAVTTTTESNVGPSETTTPGSSVEAESESSPTTVVAAAAGSSLPFTGGSAMPLVLFGLSAIVAGAALVVGQRRRAARRA